MSDLPLTHDFSSRHIGPDNRQVDAMLGDLGLDSLDQLVEQTIPATIRSKRPLQLPEPFGEAEAGSVLREIAARNKQAVSMLGMGYHGTILPPVIRRNVLENPDWYTAYTPYQPEVSQGRMEALIAFQQMVSDLTGMEIANASLLDEATAAAEAMTMSRRLCRNKSDRYFVDRECHPQTIAVVQTRARPLGIEVVIGDPLQELDNLELFGALLQYPGTTGEIRDLRPAIEAVARQQGLNTVAADILALTLITPPGDLGADIAVGNTQRFGVPMGYGGPHAAYFATRDKHKRSVPGRIIGVSVDAQGRPAYRMALQTREQHIRREKATSNICTSQVLLAVMAALYAVYHGPDGLRQIAQRVHQLTRAAHAGLQKLGYRLQHDHFFDTLLVNAPGTASDLLARAEVAGLNLRLVNENQICLTLDETSRREHIESLLTVFAPSNALVPEFGMLARQRGDSIPGQLRRESGYLSHPIFNRFHSETEMMRFLRRTSRKDVTLARSMIPLGSCTMKLNAATEMEPVSDPGFGNIHPFAPLNQTQGYRQLFRDLESMLCEITGFDGFTLQPNAGSQGEYAGLLCIRSYHHARGDIQRDICLIPSSAHGTNPASAVMAGMRVVVVKCDEGGNIDLEDLRGKAQQHAENLAAIMVTYPSTHGVFEAGIRELCDIVHQHGGQVYMDGANLNAMVGLCRPAEFGADVAHLNLHKTFAIPHGGGGPGMGPVGVKSHLLPYLPDHPVVANVNPALDSEPLGTISAAPWGSPLILPITWAYIRMMGGNGLRRATEIAILNANYIAHRLDPHYPVVFTGQNGRVAHECIIDLAPIRAACGITVDDVAKRLVDYGYHAPTMSWPVPDSLMIEPTESESKVELDRFCNAMIAIRKEIQEVENGIAAADNNLLVNAPHSEQVLIADQWDYPYSRQRACFPLQQVREDKYWPPVGRVDNVYGDRNLVCACPPMSDYMSDP